VTAETVTSAVLIGSIRPMGLMRTHQQISNVTSSFLFTSLYRLVALIPVPQQLWQLSSATKRIVRRRYLRDLLISPTSSNRPESPRMDLRKEGRIRLPWRGK